MNMGAIDISYGSFSLVCLTKGRLPFPLACNLPLLDSMLKRSQENVWSLEITGVIHPDSVKPDTSSIIPSLDFEQYFVGWFFG